MENQNIELKDLKIDRQTNCLMSEVKMDSHEWDAILVKLFEDWKEKTTQIEMTNVMTKFEIGVLLKTERVRQNKSYYAVLKGTGITQPQVEGIESGTSNYTIDIFLKYCNFLNVSLIFK